MAQPQPIVTKDLSKVYTDFWGRAKVHALVDLNLELERGEIFGLLGPNGSGKSTTIKLLLGLIFPTSGEARVLGLKPGTPAANQRLGYLPEESYLHRFLTGDETVDFYGRLFGLPRRERRRRTAELLDLVGLDRRAAARQLREYSKGMSRRHRPGAGPGQRARVAPPGRADLRPGPHRHPRDEGPHPAPEGPGQDDPPLVAPPGRRAGRVRPDRHPRPRAAAEDRDGSRTCSWCATCSSCRPRA